MREFHAVGSSSGAEQVLHARNVVLERLATGAPLNEILALLVVSAESVLPDIACSLLLLDRNAGILHLVAAPSLPSFYTDATRELPIGPNVGSCGAAAYTGKRVVIQDVLTHPNWAMIRPIAERAGIRSCWSEPILSRGGDVLGTFAVYYRQHRSPSPTEIEFVQQAAYVAGVAIERKRTEEELRRTRDELEERVRERTELLQREVSARRATEQSLRESEGRFRELAENISEVFWLTAADQSRVIYVSPAYERIWQRTAEELYANPQAWFQSIHPDDKEPVRENYSHWLEGKFDSEYRIVRPDGSIRWIHDRGFTVVDHAGRVVRVAGFAQDVTKRKLAEQEAASHREQLRKLVSDLTLAEERERRKLAVDLHDGLNQTISLAQMKLAAVRKRADGDLAEPLREIEGLVSEANRAARSLTFQLSPPILHDLGLGSAVQWLAEDLGHSYGLAVSVGESGAPAELDERMRVLLFRAIRELLINVAKHAEAKSTEVALEWGEDELAIEVSDDGKSFDPDAVPSGGIGLFGVRERLRGAGGRMEIESERSKGTRVRIRAPLEREGETH